MSNQEIVALGKENYMSNYSQFPVAIKSGKGMVLTDEDGKEYTYTHTRAYPIGDLPTIYANVSAVVGRQVTSDDMANITEIYLRVVYRNFDVGAEMSLEGGNGTHDLIAEMIKDLVAKEIDKAKEIK